MVCFLTLSPLPCTQPKKCYHMMHNILQNLLKWNCNFVSHLISFHLNSTSNFSWVEKINHGRPLLLDQEKNYTSVGLRAFKWFLGRFYYDMLFTRCPVRCPDRSCSQSTCSKYHGESYDNFYFFQIDATFFCRSLKILT